MKTSILNEEVLYAKDSIVKVDSMDIAKLKLKAKQNQRKRIRVCTHKDVNENIHEMLIVHEKSCYVRPHKHIDKIESFHIIEGKADVIIFNNDGSINQVISMGEISTGLKFYYRLPACRFHSLIIHSEVLVFHEVTNGPFRAEDTILASWSPEESDELNVTQYMNRLRSLIKKNKNE